MRLCDIISDDMWFAGAAPGSWTAYLAVHAAKVLAVDPAAMDEEVTSLPNVTHLQACAPEVLSSIAAAAGPEGVDMIVSDMNMHPGEVMPILASLMATLRPGGLLVMTLKFPGTGRQKGLWQPRLIAGLGVRFKFAKLVWLLSNTNCERTFLAIRHSDHIP